MVKIWILRYTQDGYITWFGNVLNKSGVNIGKINCVVCDLWRKLLNIDILVILQNIKEQKVTVAPDRKQIWVGKNCPQFVLSPGFVVDVAGAGCGKEH